MKSKGKSKSESPVVTLIVPKTVVVDEWGLPWDDDDENLEILSDTIVDSSRWAIQHLLTIRLGDKFYQTVYSIGATEQQDERPWEYQDEVKFTEVHKVQKTVEVWEEVLKGESLLCQ